MRSTQTASRATTTTTARATPTTTNTSTSTTPTTATTATATATATIRPATRRTSTTTKRRRTTGATTSRRTGATDRVRDRYKVRYKIRARARDSMMGGGRHADPWPFSATVSLQCRSAAVAATLACSSGSPVAGEAAATVPATTTTTITVSHCSATPLEPRRPQRGPQSCRARPRWEQHHAAGRPHRRPHTHLHCGGPPCCRRRLWAFVSRPRRSSSTVLLRRRVFSPRM